MEFVACKRVKRWLGRLNTGIPLHADFLNAVWSSSQTTWPYFSYEYSRTQKRCDVRFLMLMSANFLIHSQYSQVRVLSIPSYARLWWCDHKLVRYLLYKGGKTIKKKVCYPLDNIPCVKSPPGKYCMKNATLEGASILWLRDVTSILVRHAIAL